MLRRRISLSIVLKDAKAPSELRVFGAGWIDTTKGLYLFDAEAAVSVIEAAKAWGNRYSFDYQHAVIDDTVRPQDKKSAGSFLLEARDSPRGPELWAVDIQWAGGVADSIEALEWLYFSPLFYFDPDSRRILELLNIALTNDPATKHMTPLLAASRALVTASTMAHEEIRTRLQSALNAVLPETDTEWNWIVAVFDDSFIFDRGGKLWRAGYSAGASGVSIALPPVEVRCEYVPVLQPQGRQEDGHSALSARRDDMQIDTIIAALGLKAGATEGEALVELQALRTTHDQLLGLTGAASVSAALGMLEGWKASAASLERAHADLAKLAAESKERRVADVIAKGVAAHKITPAMVESLRIKGLEDPAWLEGHVDTLPVHAALAGAPYREPAPGAPVKKWAELTNMERHALKRTDIETYNRLRAEAGLSH